jgi:hypothetical protein
MPGITNPMCHTFPRIGTFTVCSAFPRSMRIGDQCCGSEIRWFLCSFDPWIRIRDPGMEKIRILDPVGKTGSGIRDEHPGSYFRL